uniref:Repressor LexA n=1 Tax=Dictyoglomus turgidum TaxID=513050 RepID=A0A7C3SRI9_9BACT
MRVYKTYLSKKQKEVLDFVIDFLKKERRMPTVREVAKALGLKSSGSSYFHLKALVDKGYLVQDKNGRFHLRSNDGEEYCILPLVGTIRAGVPVDSPENTEEYIPVPRRLVKNPDLSFLLRVKGDSMIEAHIIEGDLIIVQRQPTAEKGDIVVALKDGESTVKYLSEEYGIPCLRPANKRYSIIYPPFTIIGKVIGLLRIF